MFLIFCTDFDYIYQWRSAAESNEQKGSTSAHWMESKRMTEYRATHCTFDSSNA